MFETDDELSVRDGYAAWASCYDEDGNPLIALEGPAIRCWVGSIQGRRALDLGCGTGRHALALAAAGATVAALDMTPEMLARARSKAASIPEPVPSILWIRHALPRPLPLRSETFALAVLGLVAEHLDDQALALVLAEVARVLEPGGSCLLSSLHADRTADGQRARFIDPVNGVRRPIRTYHRPTFAYHAAADAAGLEPAGEQVLSVTDALAETLPRARPYVGSPLGWVARWRRV